MYALHLLPPVHLTGAAAPAPETKKKTFGTIVAVVCAGATVGLCAALWPFLSPAIRKHCLPYVPATTAQVGNAEHTLAHHSRCRLKM